MPFPYTEPDFCQTAMGDLIFRRRTIASLEGLGVLEVKLGEGFLMSSLFHVVTFPNPILEKNSASTVCIAQW